MNKQTLSKEDEAVKKTDQPSSSEPGKKKLFVEPEISTPVDVLEATTFFQTATSGGTNT